MNNGLKCRELKFKFHKITLNFFGIFTLASSFLLHAIARRECSLTKDTASLFRVYGVMSLKYIDQD